MHPSWMDREKLYGGLSTSLLKFVRHLILGNATLNHTGAYMGIVKLIHVVCKRFTVEVVFGAEILCVIGQYCGLVADGHRLALIELFTLRGLWDSVEKGWMVHR